MFSEYPVFRFSFVASKERGEAGLSFGGCCNRLVTERNKLKILYIPCVDIGVATQTCTPRGTDILTWSSEYSQRSACHLNLQA